MASTQAVSSFLLAHQTPAQRLLMVCVPLLFALILVVLVAVGIGPSPIEVPDVAEISLGLLGRPVDPAIPNSQISIVQQVRLPRVMAALLIGAALAVCGTVMQGVFRNPLADPGILGVSTGGALGAVIAFTTGLALRGVWVVPLFAFIGSLSAAFVVLLLSLERGRTNPTMLLLSGTALNVFLGALISALLLMSEEVAQAQVILNWLVGGLAGRGWRHVAVLVVPVLFGVGVLGLYARDLNLFLLGEETAQGLGTPVARTRFILLGVVALVTGISVSIAGPIGFVGLVIPHLLRLVIGPDHRILMPASALAGAIFLIVADTAARLIISYAEIPVGVITGMLGGPFFLLLLWRFRRSVRAL